MHDRASQGMINLATLLESTGPLNLDDFRLLSLTLVSVLLADHERGPCRHRLSLESIRVARNSEGWQIALDEASEVACDVPRFCRLSYRMLFGTEQPSRGQLVTLPLYLRETLHAGLVEEPRERLDSLEAVRAVLVGLDPERLAEARRQLGELRQKLGTTEAEQRRLRAEAEERERRSRETREDANLRQWIQGNGPRDWVRTQGAYWNQGAFKQLLSQLQRSPFSPLNPLRVLAAVEHERWQQFFSKQQVASKHPLLARSYPCPVCGFRSIRHGMKCPRCGFLRRF